MDSNKISAAVRLSNTKGSPNVTLSALEAAPYLVPPSHVVLLVRIRNPHEEAKSTESS